MKRHSIVMHAGLIQSQRKKLFLSNYRLCVYIPNRYPTLVVIGNYHYALMWNVKCYTRHAKTEWGWKLHALPTYIPTVQHNYKFEVFICKKNLHSLAFN